MNNIANDQAKDRVCLFTGEVDARRYEAVDALINRFVDPAFAEFDLEYIDAETSSASQILSAVSTVPFASERKVVVVQDVDCLSADEQVKIADFLPKLSARSCLILLTSEKAIAVKPKSQAKEKASTGADGEEEAPRKGLQPKLRSAVAKYGTIVHAEKLKGEALRRAVVAEARKHGKDIQQAAAEALAYSIEGSLALMQREIEKLAIYIGDRKTITLADVERLTPRPPEDRIFPMIDAIGAGKQAQAIRLLQETLMASARPEEEVMRILAMLARHFRLLYQMAYLKQIGLDPFSKVPDDVADMLPKEHNILETAEYARRAMAAQLRFFTMPQIMKCLKQVLATELVTKGVEGEASSRRLNLEILIMRLCDRERC
ncbi:MAG: DNA polymerase III subunit delta [Armatimonadota bacterium]|nr:DNA polymerase III subunit delta [Armatimonadota bacterium]